MVEEWKKMMARNLDRELEARGFSNSERARSAYHHYRNLIFGWIKSMAEEIQNSSRNPRSVLIVEDEDTLTVNIGTEMIRVKARPYPLCSRGWGKITVKSTNKLLFNEMYLWSKGDNFIWVYGDAQPNDIEKGESDRLQPGIEVTREIVEALFQSAFKKYLGNQLN